MNALTISYTAGFVLYTLLTFGWLIHVVMNKREATLMHRWITLIPLSWWLVYLLGMGDYYSGGSLNDTQSGLTAATTITGVLSQAVLFIVLASMASGFCLLPDGMLAGRTGFIWGLAGAQVLLGTISTFSIEAAKYLNFLMFILTIVQLVQLIKWARETHAIIVQHPNANLQHGTWAISYPQRCHVAKGTKSIMLVYVLIMIAAVIAGIILAILVIRWFLNAVNDANNNNANAVDSPFPELLAWTVGLLVFSIVANALLFAFIASIWRLGHTERYALLPQHTGGDFAPVHHAPVYGTAPPAYGTTVQNVGYAPAPQGTYQTAY